MTTRYNFGLTRFRLPEDGTKFEPEGATFGKIDDALAKLVEWSEGRFVVLGSAEYAAMRASYDAALQGAAERDGQPQTETPPDVALTAAEEPLTPESTAWGEKADSGYATPSVPIDA